MAKTVPVITIDGPVGSGKGTISQFLANKLGWHYLESGALYRILALVAEREQIDLDNEDALTELALHLEVEFISQTKTSPAKILLKKQDVTLTIRQETIGTMASKISAFLKVRGALLKRQKDFLKFPGLVADGRDMGTVVFPEACLKFFLTASIEERAKRRQLQLLEQGIDVTLAALVDEIARRDQRDENRPISPLKPAIDAVIIDTTASSIEEVFDQVWQLVKKSNINLI